jgi:hypothetical protein
MSRAYYENSWITDKKVYNTATDAASRVILFQVYVAFNISCPFIVYKIHVCPTLNLSYCFPYLSSDL